MDFLSLFLFFINSNIFPMNNIINKSPAEKLPNEIYEEIFQLVPRLTRF